MSLPTYDLADEVRKRIYTNKLVQGQLRIATLLRAPKDAFTNPVICKLDVISISDDIVPVYEALSWYWGSPDPTTDPFILVNGCPFQIPANLEPALRQMRWSGKDRVLWCDAICIQQSDDAEKAMQVAFMGQIYANAARVCVWLGEADADSHLALKTINEVAKMIKSSENGVKSLQEFKQGNADINYDPPALTNWLRRKALVAQDDSFEATPWVACSRLLKRPWFRRLWVVQEVFLTTRPIAMYCGADRSNLAWLQLTSTASNHIFTPNQVDLLVKAGYEAMECPPIDTLSAYSDSSNRPILQVLWDLRYQSCTLAHDRVYGILSIVKGPKLNVDYTSPAWKLFREVTVYIIKEAGNLKTLAACIPSENIIPDCPSWVPDWSIKIKQRPWRQIMYWHDHDEPLDNGVSYINRLPFRASGDLKAQIVEVTERTITVRGALLATIEDAGISSSSTGAFMQSYTATCSSDALKSPISSSQHHTQICIAATTIPEALFPVLDFARNCRCIAANCTSACVARTLFGGFPHLLLDPETGKSEIDWLTLRLSTEYLEPKSHGNFATSTYIKVSMACNKRRFCLATNGCPVLAPEDTQVGDHVVLLFGGDVPFILRRAAGDTSKPMNTWRYTLVGECYFDGVMNGEILNDVENGSLQGNVKDFTLE